MKKFTKCQFCLTLVINHISFICLNSAIETLEKGVTYVEKDFIDVIQVFYCWLLTYFTPFSSVSVVDFKQVNFSWVAT